MVVEFFRERVRQPRAPPHGHPHREVLALDVGRADVLRVGRSADNLHLAANADGRTVARLSLVGLVDLREHRYRCPR